MPEDQKTDAAAKPRGWAARLRDKWVQALIATLIGLTITAPLAFLWGIGITKAKTYYAERQNMSHEEALAEAKENVGAKTVDVIPFRNVDSKQQYIAAVIDVPPKSQSSRNSSTQKSESEDNQCVELLWNPNFRCYQIKVLQKPEGASPQVVDPGLVAYDSHFGVATPEEYRNSLLGVVDIDEDGNKEVYSKYRVTPSAGTGPYRIKINLYDSLTGESYELKGEAEVTSTSVHPSFTGKRPKEEFSTWMNQQADTLVLFNQGKKAEDEEWEQLTEKERHNKEIRDWLENNGEGFYEGQLQIEEHEGQIPETDSSSCSADDGQFEWRTYFKGALFSYDKSSDTHYVVWVPEANYEYVGNMVAGKRYLRTDVIKDNGLLAFDKEAQALVVIPVPEVEGATGNRIGAMRVEGSALYTGRYTRDNLLLAPLTLPDSINAEEEFESAANCSSR